MPSFVAEDGIAGTAWGMPMSDHLTDFESYQRRRNLSPRTIQTRRAILEMMDREVQWHPLEATTERIEAWLDTHELAPQTRYAYIVQLAAFYRWALREKLIQRDPTFDVVRPKLPKVVARPLPAEDANAALEAATPRERAMLGLAVFGGLRVCEIASLRVEDIDWSRNVLLVAEGKGNKQRTVPLHPVMVRLLTEHGLPRAGYLFPRTWPRRDGRPLKPNTVSAYLSRLLRSVDARGTAHKARTWYGTEIADKSEGDMAMVRDLLGHANFSALHHYVDYNKAKAQSVVQQLSLT